MKIVYMNNFTLKKFSEQLLFIFCIVVSQIFLPASSYSKDPPDLPSTICDQAQKLSFEIPGLSFDQAKDILTESYKRKASVTFGGSRVRGNYRADSDIDIGFNGPDLSKAKVQRMIEKINKLGHPLPIDRAPIFPGYSSRSVPTIKTPQEFFARQGVRGPLDPSPGEPFYPSGSITAYPDGRVEIDRIPPPRSRTGPRLPSGSFGAGVVAGAVYGLAGEDTGRGRELVGSALAELRDRYSSPQCPENNHRLRHLENFVNNWGPDDWPDVNRSNLNDLKDLWQDRSWYEPLLGPEGFFDWWHSKSVDEEYPPGQYVPIYGPSFMPRLEIAH